MLVDQESDHGRHPSADPRVLGDKTLFTTSTADGALKDQTLQADIKKQVTMIYSFYTVYIVANVAYNKTRLRAPDN